MLQNARTAVEVCANENTSLIRTPERKLDMESPKSPGISRIDRHGHGPSLAHQPRARKHANLQGPICKTRSLPSSPQIGWKGRRVQQHARREKMRSRHRYRHKRDKVRDGEGAERPHDQRRKPRGMSVLELMKMIQSKFFVLAFFLQACFARRGGVRFLICRELCCCFISAQRNRNATVYGDLRAMYFRSTGIWSPPRAQGRLGVVEPGASARSCDRTFAGSSNIAGPKERSRIKNIPYSHWGARVAGEIPNYTDYW